MAAPTDPAAGDAAAAAKDILQLPLSTDPPTDDNPPVQKVWIVFGATGHMGRSLVRTALKHGDKVAAVGKTYETPIEQMRGWHPDCLGLLCDVRIRESVQRAVDDAVKHFGQLDLVVNCTGYGVVAAAEDQSEHDVQDQFATNFMGTLHIVQTSLPYFREHGIPGRYIIFSSTSGALGVPGMAPYCATKYAVEGLIESMLYEVNSFGIKATLVEPGHVRDDDAPVDPSSTQETAPATSRQQGAAPQSLLDGKVRKYGHFFLKPHISPPYDSPNSPSGHARRIFQWLDTRQPTSAVRSAELVWQLAHCSYPPLRLLLGAYAVESIRDRFKSIIEEIEDWKVPCRPWLAVHVYD